ncbi:hypothetical protein ACJ41O_009769 [Fusarium nematophilum]
MFYSLDILTNPQHGVATVWLAATVGTSSTSPQRLTKKDIEEVNVPKACEMVIRPKAPFALRLQSNLLIGLSRVFKQQCRIVLTEAEKTQFEMMSVFWDKETNDMDPRAGQAKHHQITMGDDPDFDPHDHLPNLVVDSSAGELVSPCPSSPSQEDDSQMGPFTQDSDSEAEDAEDEDDFTPEIYLPEPYLPSRQRFFDLEDPCAEYKPFGEDPELEPGIELDFDIDGNLIEPELDPLPGSEIGNLTEPDLPLVPGATEANLIELELPPLPGTATYNDQPRGRAANIAGAGLDEEQVGGDDMAMTGDDALPDAAPFPRNYSKFMEVERSRREDQEFYEAWDTPEAHAQENAEAFLFGTGVGGVGKTYRGVASPLAEQFSGVALWASLQGIGPDQEPQSGPQGRRRTSAEAFEDEGTDNERRMRHKTDDDAPEMGMEAAPALDDHRSSSVAPWSRAPSVVPGSSIRGHGSAQKRLPAPSPLHARGSAVPSIERWSDLPGLPGGSDDFQKLHFPDSSTEQEECIDDFDFHGVNDTQHSTQDQAGSPLAFMDYAITQAQTKGNVRPQDRSDRRWVDFDTLMDEVEDSGDKKKFIAEAFMHVLTLASKNAIAVEQDGIAENKPFGTIRVGLTISQPDAEMADLAHPQGDVEMADELA